MFPKKKKGSWFPNLEIISFGQCCWAQILCKPENCSNVKIWPFYHIFPFCREYYNVDDPSLYFFRGYAYINDILLPVSEAIPMYMTNDLWTRNETGCACSFDPDRHDCACCFQGGCQCPDSSHFQCVKCGFEETNCGRRQYCYSQFLQIKAWLREDNFNT